MSFSAAAKMPNGPELEVKKDPKVCHDHGLPLCGICMPYTVHNISRDCDLSPVYFPAMSSLNQSRQQSSDCRKIGCCMSMTVTHSWVSIWTEISPKYPRLSKLHLLNRSQTSTCTYQKCTHVYSNVFNWAWLRLPNRDLYFPRINDHPK